MDWRKNVKKIVNKPAKLLVKIGISGNALTLIGFLFSIFASLFMILGIMYLVPIFIFLIGVFDVLDGEVARQQGTASNRGGFLDSNIDRFADIVIYLGLYLSQLITGFITILIITCSMTVSYIGARAESFGIKMKYVGIMKRAFRLIYLIIGLIIETILLEIFGKTYFFHYFILFYLILLFLTAIQRFSYVLKNLTQD